MPAKKTNTKADARTKFPLHAKGVATGASLAVPYGLQVSGGEFTIGRVRFKVNTVKRQVEALDPVPDSWFVDISETVDESAAYDCSDLV